MTSKFLPEDNTYIFQGSEQSALIKQLSIVVEIDHFEAPTFLNEAKLEMLENDILELLKKYYHETSIKEKSLNTFYSDIRITPLKRKMYKG